MVNYNKMYLLSFASRLVNLLVTKQLNYSTNGQTRLT